MSTKFEQLLDYLVNEDMEKANELFHEIVVEKSRSIYENLIAEEDKEMDESEEDEEMDESQEDEMDESEEDLEDSYAVEADDEEHGLSSDDASDKLGLDTMDFDSEEGGEEDHEKSEDEAIFDIKNAIEELEAAFAELEAAQGGEKANMGMDGEDDSEKMMGTQAFEGRRITREYTEKVNHNYGGNTQKTDGDYAGAGTGETQSKPTDNRGPVNLKAEGEKPTSKANAKNIAGDSKVGQGTNVGTSPDSLNKGIAQVSGDKLAKGMHNVDGVKSGVKTLSKETGWPQRNSREGEGVGAKTGGQEAGQTGGSTNTRSIENGQRK